MRTTLSIDDDVLTAAKYLAERDAKSIGEVISSLARQGLARAAPSTGAVGTCAFQKVGRLATLDHRLAPEVIAGGQAALELIPVR